MNEYDPHTVFILHWDVFNDLADKEGQIIEDCGLRFKIHSVDRSAGTLMIGGTKFKALFEGPPSITEVVDRRPATGAPEKDRGAQWKRERNAHRRAW